MPRTTTTQLPMGHGEVTPVLEILLCESMKQEEESSTCLEVSSIATFSQFQNIMTKVFNGRAATEEYMSSHSLTFSTPEMTLRKFALWLGDLVNLPGSTENGPRLLLYLEEKGSKKESDFAPDVDDSFKPSGAVTDMYKGIESAPSEGMMVTTPPQLTPLNRQTLEPETKFCISCGHKLKINAKFCSKCGSAQS